MRYALYIVLLVASAPLLSACGGKIVCETDEHCPTDQSCFENRCRYFAPTSGDASLTDGAGGGDASLADASAGDADGGGGGAPDGGDGGAPDGGEPDGGDLVCTPACEGGEFCDNDMSCQPCDRDDHCGSQCVTCGGQTPRCDGAECVECLDDPDCPVDTPCCVDNVCQSGVCL